MGRRAVEAAAWVLVISGSVGAGHDGAADELISRLATLGIATDRRDYLDALPRVCRYGLRDGYRISVGYVPHFFGWMFAHLEHTGWVQRVALWLCRMAQRHVLGWVGDHDVVVSTYMLASQTLGQLKEARLLDTTLVTFLTDPAVHRLWVHPAVDHHVTVTEATARMGHLVYRTPMRAVGGWCHRGSPIGPTPLIATGCAPSWGCPRTARWCCWRPGRSGWATCLMWSKRSVIPPTWCAARTPRQLCWPCWPKAASKRFPTTIHGPA